MVLGGPEAVEAGLVHLLGEGHGVVEGLHQLFVGVTAAVGVSAAGAYIIEIDLTDIEN